MELGCCDADLHPARPNATANQARLHYKDVMRERGVGVAGGVLRDNWHVRAGGNDAASGEGAVDLGDHRGG